MLGPKQGLLAFFVRQTLLRPIYRETGRKNQHAQLREAQLVERGERRTNIGAAFHGATTAVDDQVRGAWKRVRPRLDLGKAFGVAPASMKLSSLNVPRGVQTSEANEQYCWSSFALSQFLYEIGGLNGLRGRPGVCRTLRAHEGKQHQCESEKRGNDYRKIPDCAAGYHDDFLHEKGPMLF